MTDKNRNHVAVYSDKDVTFWALTFPSEVQTCEEQATEMIGHCERLFETLDDFLVSTQIEFHVHCFPPGKKLPATVNDEDRIEAVERVLRDADGLTVQDVLEAVDVSNSNVRWIPRIVLLGNKVHVELEAGPVFADRTKHTVEYRKNKPVDGRPARDPLEIELLHHPGSEYPEIGTEFVTSVVVAPLSDIWFEDTELGRANARQLAAFLERIQQVFPVEKVERTAEWLSIDKLEAIY